MDSDATAAAPDRTVEVERSGGIATIALNRPEKRNAINRQLHEELTAALREVQRDRSVRVLVLTGRGPGFCAGQDLGELALAGQDPTFRIDEHVRTTFNATVRTIRDLRVPVVAAVNGVAAGAGWSLALAADLRICTTDARFTQAFTRIGLVPDTGSTWLLPRLVGTARALQLAYTGDMLDAPTALEWGLVNEVVEPERLAERTGELAAQLAAMPPVALALTKRAVHRSLDVSLDDALEYEAQLQQHAASTHDHVEGVSAFLERREPRFEGR